MRKSTNSLKAIKIFYLKENNCKIYSLIDIL